MHDIHKYNVKIVGSDSKPVAYLDNLLDVIKFAFYMMVLDEFKHTSIIIDLFSPFNSLSAY